MSGVPQRAWVEQIMGLPVSVHMRGVDLQGYAVESAVAALYDSLRDADKVFSTYRDDSDLNRWYRGEIGLDAADPAIPEVIALCEDAVGRTRGFFDATVSGRWDPTGLVKGWAVRRAARHLTALTGHGWCVNAGGDVLVYTPDGEPGWRIGIEDPRDPSRILRVIERRDGAVATSGLAHRGAHILNPFSGKPATSVPAVTVTGPDLMWADVYATAAVAQGVAALDWLDEADGYEALMVAPSGLLRVTPGWNSSNSQPESSALRAVADVSPSPDPHG